MDMWQLCAALLHLGNVTFVTESGPGNSRVQVRFDSLSWVYADRSHRRRIPLQVTSLTQQHYNTAVRLLGLGPSGAWATLSKLKEPFASKTCVWRSGRRLGPHARHIAASACGARQGREHRQPSHARAGTRATRHPDQRTVPQVLTC